MSLFLFVILRVRFPGQSPATYINEALNQQSYIDYVLVTCQDVSDFAVLEPDINFSDHLPLFLTIAMSLAGLKVVIIPRLI